MCEFCGCEHNLLIRAVGIDGSHAKGGRRHDLDRHVSGRAPDQSRRSCRASRRRQRLGVRPPQR
ncbi:protein of unknown function [Magnetospirillum sp. XM-1]|nr:protein of unknown function [Magnetospirillum sp. XM-1]